MAADLAVVAPIAIMQKLEAIDVLGDYQMVLAQEVLKRPHMWADFYTEMRRHRTQQGHELPKVILDNGVVELDTPLTAREIMTAADAVRADVVILPDKLRNPKETEMLVKMAVEELEDDFLRCHPQREAMVVVQRKGVRLTPSSYWMGVVEVVSHAERLMLNSSDKVPIKWIGLPRALEDDAQVRGFREGVAGTLRENNLATNFHLLGFSRDIEADIAATTTPGVRGIDSAYPVWHGNDYGVFPRDQREMFAEPVTKKRPEFYMDVETFTPQVIVNILRYRSWINERRF